MVSIRCDNQNPFLKKLLSFKFSNQSAFWPLPTWPFWIHDHDRVCGDLVTVTFLSPWPFCHTFDQAAQYFSVCSIVASFRVHHCCGAHLAFFDLSVDKFPWDCCRHAGFQTIFIACNIELNWYSIFTIVTSIRMQHCYGILLAFLKLFIPLYSAGLPGYGGGSSIYVCLFVISYLLSRYMPPEGPWQRLRRCLSSRGEVFLNTRFPWLQTVAGQSRASCAPRR